MIIFWTEIVFNRFLLILCQINTALIINVYVLAIVTATVRTLKPSLISEHSSTISLLLDSKIKHFVPLHYIVYGQFTCIWIFVQFV